MPLNLYGCRAPATCSVLTLKRLRTLVVVIEIMVLFNQGGRFTGLPSWLERGHRGYGFAVEAPTMPPQPPLPMANTRSAVVIQ
jgi:hypothetical protein